jgi:hypothetical protein
MKRRHPTPVGKNTEANQAPEPERSFLGQTLKAAVASAVGAFVRWWLEHHR